MDYDKVIVKICLDKNGKVNPHIQKIIKSRYPNILEYLTYRYNDSTSIIETINRIKYNISIRPSCKKCGGKVKYISKNIFRNYCCKSCATIDTKPKYVNTCIKKYGVDIPSKLNTIKEKTKETCLKRYGVNSPMQSKKIKEKSKETCLRKYSVDNIAKSEYAKEKSRLTCLERYGVEYSWQSEETKEKSRLTCLERYGVEHFNNFNKSRLTCLERYGVDNYTKTKEYKEKSRLTCLERYGVECFRNQQKSEETCIKKYGVKTYFLTQEFKEFMEVNKELFNIKRNETKRKNHTFNTSLPEEELYLYIKEKFPEVKRQYRDKERYPFLCDFYIPSLDTFIELNGHWTHNTHPYDPYNVEDQKKVEEWKSKHTKFYDNAIRTWTMYDVNKRKTAKENNLNYKEVWSLEEGKKFIDRLSCQHKTKD